VVDRFHGADVHRSSARLRAPFWALRRHCRHATRVLATRSGRLAFAVTFASPSSSWRCSPRCSRPCQERGLAELGQSSHGLSWNCRAFKFFRPGTVMSAHRPFSRFDLVLACGWRCVCCAGSICSPLPVAARQPRGTLERAAHAVSFLSWAGTLLAAGLFIKPAEGEPRDRPGRVRLGEFVLLLEARQGRRGLTGNLGGCHRQREYRKATARRSWSSSTSPASLHNCNLNENMCSAVEIQQLFKPYVLVKLYTTPSRLNTTRRRTARVCKTAAGRKRRHRQP